MLVPWRGLTEEAHWTVRGAVRRKKKKFQTLVSQPRDTTEFTWYAVSRSCSLLIGWEYDERNSEWNETTYDVGQGWWRQWGESLLLSADENLCSGMSGWWCSEDEYWNEWSGDFEHVIDQYHHLRCGEVADIYIHSKSGVYRNVGICKINTPLREWVCVCRKIRSWYPCRLKRD